MKVLIAYGTTEGQTRKIVDAAATQVIALGHDAEVFDTSLLLDGLHPETIDKIIVAGSVHEGLHQESVELFALGNLAKLQAKPSMFISVSLAAAFEEKAADAAGYISDFSTRTGWTPDQSLAVAGAVRSDEYDYFQQQILEHIILKDQEDFRPDEAQEFTDWTGLASSVKAFLDSH